jgi:hypothetical protein
MAAQSRLHRNLLIGVIGCGVIALLLVAMFRSGGLGLSGPGRILAGTAGVALLVGWWGVFATRLNGTLDEYQRWAERRAWYVGGLAGLLASAPVFTFIGLGGLHWLDPASDTGPAVSRAFARGYMLPFLMQMIGSSAYALWFHLAKR